MTTQHTDFAKFYTNLASPRLGGTALSCSDDFFAAMHRVLKDEEPIFVPDKYDDHGKWMDGWESRRKRSAGHDWCIVRLGAPGVVHNVIIDTSHFTGNFPPEASLEACNISGDPNEGTEWITIIAKTKLSGDTVQSYNIDHDQTVTHVRLNIFPDGGVARLRIYGDPVPAWENGEENDVYELSSLRNGGKIVSYNDAHYGNVWTMLTEGRGINMGDGWETRRRREPGNDWIIVKLGAKGAVERVEVDTAHFKGNYPDRCSLEGGIGPDGPWQEILSQQKLSADTIHTFDIEEMAAQMPIDHVRLNIYPDGGVSRLRIFGKLAK